MRRSLPVLLLATMLVSCATAERFRDLVMVEQRPVVILLLPTALEVVPFARGDAGGVDSLMTEHPVEDWQDITRIVYDAFREEFGADRVTLLTESPGGETDDPSTADWSAYSGAVVAWVHVSGRYEQGTFPYSYTPVLATIVRFWEVRAEYNDALYPIGAVSEPMGSVSADEVTLDGDDEPRLAAIDVMLERFPLETLRPELTAATRDAVAAYLAEVRSNGG